VYAEGVVDMEVIAIITIVLLATFLFVIILVAVKKGVEKAAYELKEDFINEFNIKKAKEDDSN
jgi:hypothetical protein